ncbi:MAG TPA: AbrB/MazE/SpoVT family DNA-binding domain-containing protein [Acidimicrobiales bacterium]|nr:AbrB/MazE/SpoVT family DNA-binding domain-containing protein [Acidimicrobiales bacterium]
MKATIDKAGRVVLPKSLRDKVGIRSGQVEVTVEGSGIHIEPVPGENLDRNEEGRLVVPKLGARIDDEMVQVLRDALQR